MVKWIGSIQWGRVLLVGFLYSVISVVIRQLEMIWTFHYYTDPKYFGLWNPLMMPVSRVGGSAIAPLSSEFYIVSGIITFMTGMSLAIIYYYLKDYLPKGYMKRSFFFADLMVATSFIFFTLPSILLFNAPYGLLASWFVSSFIILLVTSLTIVKVIGK